MSLEPPRTDRRFRAWVGAMAATGLALRLAFALWRGELDWFSRGYTLYLMMADCWLAGHGLYAELTTRYYALRTPGYIGLLAALTWLFQRPWWLIALINCAFGAATVVVAALVARRLFGRSAGLAAAVGVAFYPYYLAHDGMLQDTALYTLLLLVTIHLAVGARTAPSPRAGVALGLSMAATVMVRVALYPTALALLAWEAWAWRRSARRTLLACLLAFAAGLLPWVARNTVRIGAPVLTSDFGRSFWTGNNPTTFDGYPNVLIDKAERDGWARLDPGVRSEIEHMDELGQDRAFRKLAIDWITAHPLEAARGAAVKVWAGFSPIKNPRTGTRLQNIAYTLSYATIVLLALAALVRLRGRRERLRVLLIPFALFAIQAAVVFTHTAYRIHLDVYLIVIASSWAQGLRRRDAGGDAGSASALGFPDP